MNKLMRPFTPVRSAMRAGGLQWCALNRAQRHREAALAAVAIQNKIRSLTWIASLRSQ